MSSIVERFKNRLSQFSFIIAQSLIKFLFIEPEMHLLQPKHTKLKPEEVKKLLEKYNISISQLPKIKSEDPSLAEGCTPGDVIKIERKEEDKLKTYYRVVVP